MIRVWHAKTFKGGAVFPADFVAVAEVDTTDPEVAFRDTNHIDHDWWDNPGVTRLPAAQRSTSVGDVIEDMDGGALLTVSPIGYERLEGPTPVRVLNPLFA